jgi:tripartite-type tricarboxylate transporter receptor subunit TctC
MAAALALAVMASFVAPAKAQQNYPNKTITLIVPYPPGGGVDVVARVVAEKLSGILGQQVIVDNRTGGNSLVAANAVLQAPRDGQTFLVDAANQVTNPFLIKDLPFDYATTWLPVTKLSDFPQVLAVKQEFAARTLAEYVAAAREKPGTISYGTPPAAGMGHMAGEELQRRAGIKLIHAPYRGGADAARDIGAGAIDSVFITTSSIRPPLAAGRVRILAVTSLKRVALYPDVPTIAESGYPGYDMIDWNGLFAANGTPAELVARMQAVCAEAIRDAKVRERMDAAGAVLVADKPAEFRAWLEGQRTLLGKLIVEGNIKLG